VGAFILYEGIRRFYEPQDIHSLPMLAIAVVDLGVNLMAMRILESGTTSLNVKGAYLEVWSDMLGSLGVIAAAALIWLTSWTWIDAVVAIGIGLWVLPRTWTLLKETTNILLEGVPDGIDLDAVTATLTQLPGVDGIHDLHVWALTSGMPSLSAHLVLQQETDADQIRGLAEKQLYEKFDIVHVTLQAELKDCRDGREHHGLH